MELRDVDNILVHLFYIVRHVTLVYWHNEASDYQEIGPRAALHLFIRPENALLAKSEQEVHNDEGEDDLDDGEAHHDGLNRPRIHLVILLIKVVPVVLRCQYIHLLQLYEDVANNQKQVQIDQDQKENLHLAEEHQELEACVPIQVRVANLVQ